MAMPYWARDLLMHTTAGKSTGILTYTM